MAFYEVEPFLQIDNNHPRTSGASDSEDAEGGTTVLGGVSQQRNPLAMAAESLAGAFTWKNNQVAPRMLGFKELKRSSTRRSCMSIETTTTEKVDWEIGEEDEVIETDLLEYPGQRRCVLSFGNYKDDNTSNNNNRLESLEAQTDFPSVLVNWLKSNKETATDDEEQNIFVEESFIVSQTREEGEEEGVVEQKNRTCFLLFGFRVEDERTRRFFLKNWKEVSGLGGIMFFLTSKGYFLKRASLLQRTNILEHDIFQFVILVETKVSSSRLGHLLQMVQRTRETKNTGFISLYHKKLHKDKN